MSSHFYIAALAQSGPSMQRSGTGLALAPTGATGMVGHS